MLAILIAHAIAAAVAPLLVQAVGTAWRSIRWRWSRWAR